MDTSTDSVGWSRHKPFRFEGGTQTSLLHGQNVKKLTVVSFSILILVCMYSLRWELESGLANSNQWVPQPAGPGSEAGQESETIRASEPEDPRSLKEAATSWRWLIVVLRESMPSTARASNLSRGSRAKAVYVKRSDFKKTIQTNCLAHSRFDK